MSWRHGLAPLHTPSIGLRLPAPPLPALLLRRVTDSSGEGFAVRLYKAARPQGVVRAFSDVPSAFSSDFNKVQPRVQWRLAASGQVLGVLQPGLVPPWPATPCHEPLASWLPPVALLHLPGLQVEKVMKALHVRRLYLWPRFQAQARQDLEARPPQVCGPARCGIHCWLGSPTLALP